MWRVLRLTLAFAVTVATVANAASRSDAAQANFGSVLQQSTAIINKAQTSAPGDGFQLQIGGALALTQPSLRAEVGAQGRSRIAPRLSRRVALGWAGQSRLPRWLDLGGTRPALAYPVTASISLGLRYSYQRGEDLAFKAATTGALDADYQNHKVLVRAQWEF